MTSKLLIRIAAFCILIHLLGHTFGHTIWDKPEDPRMMDVVTSMKGYKAEFMGASKSMADYYHGYSLMIIGLFAITTWILWQASANINEHRQAVTRMLLPIGLGYLCFGVIEYLYFFPFAASMSFLAGLFTTFAVVRKSPS
jgi:hypothetical protein